MLAHMWFDYEVQVALGPHLADVSGTVQIQGHVNLNIIIAGSI